MKTKNKVLSFVILLSFLLLPIKSFAQWNLDNLSQFNLPDAPVSGIISGIVTWLLGILSAASLIGFMISGIMYLTAAGSDNQIEKAKKGMMYSIIGVVVGLSGFVIFQAAQYMLSGASTF